MFDVFAMFYLYFFHPLEDNRTLNIFSKPMKVIGRDALAGGAKASCRPFTENPIDEAVFFIHFNNSGFSKMFPMIS